MSDQVTPHPIKFGYFPAPEAAGLHSILRTAQLIDELGFDVIGIQDHPYQRRFLDTWTLLSVIGAQTSHISLVPDVAALPLHQPAVLAKSAASLDLITGGRVELGLGSGFFWDAIEAMGGVRRTPGDAMRSLRDAIHISRLMWSDERSITYEGPIYSIKGIHPGPQPAHPIGIWLGAYGPKMLRMVGELGDAWIPTWGYIDPPGITAANERIDDGALAAGRTPADIRRILNLGELTQSEDLVELMVGFALEYRLDTFLLNAPLPEDRLRQLVAEVFPAVRERVDAERG